MHFVRKNFMTGFSPKVPDAEGACDLSPVGDNLCNRQVILQTGTATSCLLGQDGFLIVPLRILEKCEGARKCMARELPMARGLHGEYPIDPSLTLSKDCSRKAAVRERSRTPPEGFSHAP